jgi:hypothetical protein
MQTSNWGDGSGLSRLNILIGKYNINVYERVVILYQQPYK